ncbi:hypothetical protein CYMTET_20182 [Cymbomonas tetramitiformis]|uniref:Carbohydrate kinase FGGY N-terminal domain-containing protein n=1 Tax=Cymbomonas tetramitiformis TaxID=36881 RepID=A0AAE0G4K9_9CHLO|nr:hypothetical protein CYMTET_20182 [Cymbomonas tetramitiformis]
MDCHSAKRPRVGDAKGQYVIGVDGGTESIRAGIFDLEGTPLAFSASAYATQYPQPGWAEQRPTDWWDAMGVAVRNALREANVLSSDISAICLDTTCCTVVALDEQGNPLRPALLWMDMRSAPQVLTARFPVQLLCRVSENIHIRP